MTSGGASPFTAASEFGFAKTVPEASSAVPQPGTTLASVESTVTGAWYQHPGVAVWVLVLVAAVLLERTTKPVASGSAKGSLGPAKAGIEGEI